MSMGARSNRSRAALDTPDAVRAGAADIPGGGIRPTPDGMDAAAREAAERLGRALGLSRECGERLSPQSKENMAALARCRSVLTQALQASSESWMEMVQAQWKRNFAGMERLIQAKSLQEFRTIQDALDRENLEHILEDGRSIAARSPGAADAAGKAPPAIADRTGATHRRETPPAPVATAVRGRFAAPPPAAARVHPSGDRRHRPTSRTPLRAFRPCRRRMPATCAPDGRTPRSLPRPAVGRRDPLPRGRARAALTERASPDRAARPSPA